ncbi:MAG: hypothetical protein RL660_2450 [Bacteroidota bacterium]|jgi:two-component system LytT family response regulator
MIKAVILDDEQLIGDFVESVVQKYLPNITVAAKCTNMDIALEAIYAHSPQILLLDIQIAAKQIYDLLQAIDVSQYKIIIISAYPEHAIKMYDFKVHAYLLKPIEVPKLVAALQNAVKDIVASTQVKQDLPMKELLGLPTEDGNVVVPVSSIIRLEAKGNYTLVYLDKMPKHTIVKPLGEFDKLLPRTMFMRIHKSHIINMRSIVKYLRARPGTVIMADNAEIPIGASFKEDFEAKIVL